MVKISVQELRKIMDKPKNIRNISVIAHVDHGKSTLSDALLRRAGVISDTADRFLDNTPEEMERGITIQSTGISMYYKADLHDKGEEEEYLINLIDSPGHVDFSSEVTAALRVTDGALVIVDAVEGVCVQTETVLRQAMTERIKPILMINKVDRFLMELNSDPEEMYRSFCKIIDLVNVITSTYSTEKYNGLELDPTLGNVVFGAGRDKWAFWLSTFAKIYAKKFGVDEGKMMRNLWGDAYYDPETKKFTEESTNESGKALKRGFVHFIMEPIVNLLNTPM